MGLLPYFGHNLAKTTMDGNAYTSLIKINGVPILPPLMTKEIKEETSHYKKLAIEIEKRLVATRIKNIINGNNRKVASKGRKIVSHRWDSFDDTSFNFNHKVRTNTTEVGLHSSSNVSTVVDATPKPVECITDNDNLSTRYNGNSNSDDGIDSNNEQYLVPSIVSRSESTRSTTAETTPDIWKPQIPKTLNIVPLTLCSPNYAGDEEYSEEESENVEDIPKLKRQGSYVLDNPSPMLLAHLRAELANASRAPNIEYVPSCPENTNRRKEWNIAQAQMEWEQQSEWRASELISMNPRKRPSNPRNNETVSLQTKTKIPLRSYSSTRSVDCIQSILATEFTTKRDAQGSYDRKYATDSSGEKACQSRKWHRCDSLPAPKMMHKLGGSLGNVNGDADVSRSECEERKFEDIFSRNSATENVREEHLKNTEMQHSAPKLKPYVTPNKLLTVFKEIQGMHKKQMAELVDRQQKEQSLLREEFEKQQLLLLTEIRNSFPEISTPILPDSFSSSKISISEKSSFGDIDSGEHKKDTGDPCPLDVIYGKANTDNDPAASIKCSEFDEAVEGTDFENTSNCEPKVSDERKQSNVSRQLFPLDSKTVHVPVLDNTVYDTKHIKAATVINAYARGYLVRRMMKTDRVIALKNTYKEALQCMLKLHVDAPLNRSEFNFLHRLQLQCDAAAMNIADVFSQSAEKRMQVLVQDREMKRSRTDRPLSSRSYSFATQRTLARKRLKEMGDYHALPISRSSSTSSRSRCQTWTSDFKEKLVSPNILHQTIKRSTSAGTVRKPWR